MDVSMDGWMILWVTSFPPLQCWSLSTILLQLGGCMLCMFYEPNGDSAMWHNKHNYAPPPLSYNLLALPSSFIHWLTVVSVPRESMVSIRWAFIHFTNGCKTWTRSSIGCRRRVYGVIGGGFNAWSAHHSPIFIGVYAPHTYTHTFNPPPPFHKFSLQS